MSSKTKPGKPSPKKVSLKSLKKRIVGTWNLISAEDKQPDGTWKKYSLGNPPSGYFIYDATGHASVQVMITPPQKIAKPDSPTPEEALAIFNNYIAYYGTYTIDAENISVQVVGGLDPTQIGGAQVRPYKLSGDRLLIGNDQAGYKRTLKRFK